MNDSFFKDYIQRLRKLELEEIYLQITEDLSPELKDKVLKLVQVEYKDRYIHAYYGELKIKICAFMNFWNETIDPAIKTADKYTHTATKNEEMELIDKTIKMQQAKQLDFVKQYLPIASLEEKDIYEDIESKYNSYIENLNKLKKEENSVIVRTFPTDSFKKNMKVSLEMTLRIFDFTHSYMAMILADRLYYIRSSLEETYIRIRNNLKSIQLECEQEVNALVLQLYEYNQRQLNVSRLIRSQSLDFTEIAKCIQKVRNKIENRQQTNQTTLKHLEEETEFWKKKITDFEEIADLLKKLKCELENVTAEEEVYGRNRCVELPGTKRQCWDTIGENLTKMKADLNTKIINAAKALMTHFCINVSEGYSKTISNFNLVRPYHVDRFGYRVYELDYGLHRYKETCDGQLEEVTDDLVYYYDVNGRYYLDEKGSKVYIRKYCASSYKLNDNNLLYKVTLDCGHSDRPNTDCRMQIKDKRGDVILPTTEPVDIKGKLDSETVTYLWDTFGPILPEVLAEVAEVKPKNPIHFLAHNLLRQKYKRTTEETRQKAADNRQYKADILKAREEKAQAIAQEWEAKQVKRRKPEESYDTENLMNYHAYLARQEFIQQLNCYNG